MQSINSVADAPVLQSNGITRWDLRMYHASLECLMSFVCTVALIRFVPPGLLVFQRPHWDLDLMSILYIVVSRTTSRFFQSLRKQCSTSFWRDKVHTLIFINSLKPDTDATWLFPQDGTACLRTLCLSTQRHQIVNCFTLHLRLNLKITFLQLQTTA